MPVKVLDNPHDGNVQNIQSGIRWAADNGARIINLSWGKASLDAPLQEAVEYAQAKGCLIIAAAGNHLEGENPSILYPAALPEVVAVGALTKDYNIAPFSNTGNNLNLVAPGTEILSYSVGALGPNKLTLSDGTSVASAFVSGVAALVWSAHPDWSAQRVISSIRQSARRLDQSKSTSYFILGVPSAYRAIEMATP